MKVLIAYSTRKGATEEVARRLATRLSDNGISADLADIRSRPDLTAYDAVILGASIRAGLITYQMKNFCEANENVLLKKQLYIYVSSLTTGEKAVAYIDANFPARLLAHSKKSIGAGGRVELEKLGFLPRFMLKKVANIHKNQETFDDAAIADLAGAVVGK